MKDKFANIKTEYIEDGDSKADSKEIIADMLALFMKQAYTPNLKTKQYQNSFEGLKVKVSFGQGNSARIPWISFLGKNQTTSQGIYPVLLFYKEYHTLIISYGVSETNKPTIKWNAIGDKVTIKEYFGQKGLIPDRYGNSYVYKAYDTSVSLDFKNIESDLKNLIREYKELLDSSLMESKVIKKQTFTFSSFISDLATTGLIFSDQLVTRFVLSLLTKPFVILSGLAGSGKTQLAITFAKWICENESEQICFVPVGADWTNREFLLGYPNALERGKYVKPDNGVLDLLLRADANKEKPYFLILDEMNLSYVERYFADFLSAMESGEKIPLMEHECDGVPASVSLPKNLFIIGTINVDETTYMFSPKVLDRANVIEFRIMPEDLDLYFQKSTLIDKETILSKGRAQAASFVELATSDIDSQALKARNEIVGILKFFFRELKNVQAEFGYRTANEMFRFMSLGQKLDDSLDMNAIVDAAIIQKLLPKLHGSRKKVESTLKALWNLCVEDENYTLKVISELPEKNKIKYPLSAEKIWRMYRIAQENGFTSFAEA